MSNTQQTPSGWYPDPSGPGLDRWWDGMNWSATTRVSPVGVQPYSMAAQQLSTADPTTTFAWVLAAWPLISLVNNVIYVAVSDSTATGFTGTFGVPWLLNAFVSLAAYAGFVLISYRDYRELSVRGIRPFAWGWSFLPIVYVIGRAVTVYGQTRRGLAPLFVWIGAVVLGWVVEFGIGIALGFATGFSSGLDV